MAGSALIEFDRMRGTRIAGADEAGRGCLAGPIVAAGVVFDYDTLSEEDLSMLAALNDSKKLSASRREFLFGEITRIAASVAAISRSLRPTSTRWACTAQTSIASALRSGA